MSSAHIVIAAVLLLAKGAVAELSPHQRAILESKSQPPIDACFSFDAPAGPQFTEEEKRAQREKGAGVVTMVRKAFETGAESVTIPPGDYGIQEAPKRIKPERYLPREP